MLVQDHLQVTKSWFTGILEGEGSFSPAYAKNKRCIRIANTDVDIIKACENYLDQNYICYDIYSDRKPRNKISYTINIREYILDYVEIFYKLIESSLECRGNEYDQLFGTSTTIRPLSVDLDWLAGIFEAEGSFSLVFSNQNKAQLEIEISNTNKRIIDKIILNFRKYYLSYYINTREATETWKKRYIIKICGIKRCRRFLLLMKNKWVAERNIKRTSLIQEFIDSRLNLPYKSPYTDREYSIVRAVRDLNR